MVPLIQFDGQQRDPLIDVVVQLSGDPGAFLFVGFNQQSTNVGKSLLRQLAVGKICGQRALSSS